MQQPLEDKTHEMFWQQMLRWLVAGTQGRVTSSTPTTLFADDQRVSIRVDARDKSYLPLADGHVEASVMGPKDRTSVSSFVPIRRLRHLYSRIRGHQARLVRG
jgi:hypothetical protein